MRAALTLIGERGADRVGPMDVVKHLGIPRARMRACFPGEDDFWRAVAARLNQRIRANREAVLASDQRPLGRLRSLIATQAGLVMGQPAIPAALFSCRWRSDSPLLREAFLAIRGEFHAVLAQLLEEARAAGEVATDLDSDKAARQIVEVFQGMVASWWLMVDSSRLIAEIWEKVEQIIDAPSVRVPAVRAGRARRLGPGIG